MKIGIELFVALVILGITACGSNISKGNDGAQAGITTSDPVIHSSATQDCMTMYSRENGYTFDEQSMKGVVISSTTITSPHDTMDDITKALNQLKSTCMADGGHDCDPELFQVTPQAELCLAKAYGLADGISPWVSSLDYNHSYKTVIWSVRNTTSSSSEIYHKRGNYVTTTTTDGALLESGGWEAME